ncbi:Putative hydroxypyruvate reductase [Planctomycetes bacterium MalM25]|nr:Putative hydroxypyruvate reductase [Planctomycetes bacterium MalM25]
MSRPLLDDALSIWRAGVDAVAPERLLAEAIEVDDRELRFVTTRGDEASAARDRLGKVYVVGGGKAGAGMARGLIAALEPLDLGHDRLTGVLSVPAGCEQPIDPRVKLIAGRPAGVNEPRPAGAAAVGEMLSLVGQAGPDDLAIVLLSGGGSALLPAPIEGVTLEEKTAVARCLSAAGATIDQLNTVRQHLSRIKGGGLTKSCRAGRLITLVISDVLGDPLDLIASGPTVPPSSTPADALAVLESLSLIDEPELANVVRVLREKQTEPFEPTTDATTLLLANNATAVDAAGVEAERLGYRHAMHCATASEGFAEPIGAELAQMATSMRDSTAPDSPNCLITGGEPTVKLAPADMRGKGGRNQQLALAALQKLGDCRGVALVSGGTDGEDGPTDAAGAMIDESIAAKLAGADLADHLARNDAYPLFESADALLMTGPTHTNVCDLRVVTVGKS